MNSAPRPTDVLANERTFLAYLRTALSFVALGFVIARFALFNEEIAVMLHTGAKSHGISTGFGTGIALFGALIAAYGGYRYLATDRALASKRAVRLPPAIAGAAATVVTIVGIAVGIGLLAVH